MSDATGSLSSPHPVQYAHAHSVLYTAMTSTLYTVICVVVIGILAAILFGLIFIYYRKLVTLHVCCIWLIDILKCRDLTAVSIYATPFSMLLVQVIPLVYFLHLSYQHIIY